jgi:hypothetical protein
VSFSTWKSSTDLEPSDLKQYPVWNLVGSGDLEELDAEDVEEAEEMRDESTVTPRTGFGFERRPATLGEVALVGVTIRFANGSEHLGFVWHDDPDRFYGLTLVTDEWHTGIAPEHGVGISMATGIAPSEIFPISFESMVEVKVDYEAARATLCGRVDGPKG